MNKLPELPPPSVPTSDLITKSGCWAELYTADKMRDYGDACVAAEQDRILRIVYEQSQKFGSTGECLWMAIKSHVRYGLKEIA